MSLAPCQIASYYYYQYVHIGFKDFLIKMVCCHLNMQSHVHGKNSKVPMDLMCGK